MAELVKAKEFQALEKKVDVLIKSLKKLSAVQDKGDKAQDITIKNHKKRVEVLTKKVDGLEKAGKGR